MPSTHRRGGQRGAAICLLILLHGCAASSIIETSAGFVISLQAATGVEGIGRIRSTAFKMAEDKCRKIGRKIGSYKLSESRPPYLMGNYPSVQLEFSCVSEK